MISAEYTERMMKIASELPSSCSSFLNNPWRYAYRKGQLSLNWLGFEICSIISLLPSLNTNSYTNQIVLLLCISDYLVLPTIIDCHVLNYHVPSLNWLKCKCWNFPDIHLIAPNKVFLPCTTLKTTINLSTANYQNDISV